MLLDEEKISYTEIDITNQRNKLKELELKTKYDTVPQIFVGDKFIGGCDDLLELHRIGDFDKIFR